MTIRKATEAEIPAVERIYDEIHTAEEAGELTVGWARGVYPTRETAQAALLRGDLFVLEDGGEICGAAIINRLQVDVYAGAPWAFAAEEGDVCVLHTLAVPPHFSGRGCGGAFLRFYEEYARRNGLHALRLDTNARNMVARAMYKRYGYREAAVVPTVFNGISGVELVLLEKALP